MKKLLFAVLFSVSVICNFVGLYFLFKKYYGDKRQIPFVDCKAIFVGDSRVAGAEWRKGLDRLDVINAGISGITSGQLLTKLDSVLSGRSPEFAVVQVGVNDIRTSVPLDSTVLNYQGILRYLKVKSIKPILTSTISIRKDFAQDVIPENLVNERVASLNVALQGLARQEKVRFIDVTGPMSSDGRLRMEFTYDGIHLSDDGEMILYESLRTLLN